jgi:hypothetical protein
LRVTIPVEKEVLYFIVPSHDADLLEHIAVHKARLDRPGQGFIYRTIIRAMAVNLKVRRGKPSSAASMEQIIAALDDIRGSSEWRRVSSARSHGVSHKKDTGELVSLSLTAEEGRVSDFVRAAMSVGAGGATLLPLEFRSYGKASPSSRVSHARESCDLIIPKGIQEAVLNTVDALGLFSAQVSGFAELTGVSRAVTYTG